ncbi:hypothetical protein QBC36DRAFT_391167 [Triangularia setosa]|uniref:Protein kinase domain-containing protein n=1 Tax=Triangularia setosa TaxID=2587417 RepID=A0AAN6VY42_9PEZI|nr:hypothetical protein QBC36DRAFT_391167 [Podospora setosa]
MDPSHNIIDALWRPKFILAEHRLRALSHSSKNHLTGPTSWHASSLNPKNRVDSLPQWHTGWRIDGATICATRFFAVPLDLDHVSPLSIFVDVPDQNNYPAALRSSLDTARGVPIRDGHTISRLGISRHLCRALQYHCAQGPKLPLLARYNRLPFGSRIVVENIAADVADMRISIQPNYDLERSALTVDTLRSLWPEILLHNWPPVVDLASLQLVKQIHDTVSIVSTRTLPAGRGIDTSNIPPIAIFKSSPDTPLDHMYHELRFLLTVSPHPNIMARPLALVTKRVAFGGKQAVVGFLLRYFPRGSIRDILPALQRAGTLTPSTKLAWCRQIASALLHIEETAGTFYSDLRPDNVLLADDGEGVVLCDFEQRGNWHEWCAPEVLFPQYIENIRAAITDLEHSRQNVGDNSKALEMCRHLVTTFDNSLPLQKNSFSSKGIETPVEAKNRPWFRLTSQQQEKASVYSLGLFMYTVFEGLSGVCSNIANEWPINPDIEFPSVKDTPVEVMSLVRRCTAEASQWQENGERDSLPPRIVRGSGGVLYPAGRTNLEPNTAESITAVLDAAHTWWMSELDRAQRFFKSDAWCHMTVGQVRLTLSEVVRELDNTRFAVS